MPNISVARVDRSPRVESKKPGSGRCPPSRLRLSHVDPPKSHGQISNDTTEVAWTRKVSRPDPSALPLRYKDTS